MKIMQVFCSVVLFLLLISSAHAKVYKCLDENGKTSFQSEPCAEGQKEKEVKGIKNTAAGGSGEPLEINTKAFVGTWCFYEQFIEGGDTVSEQVTIKLSEDGKYSWKDKYWNQTGTWTLKGETLNMTNVGNHQITKVTANHIDMVRFSNMKWRRGGC